MSTPSVLSTVPSRSDTMAPPAQRLLSLDAFRGFTMFWLVGGKAFVAAVAGALGLAWVTRQLTHSAWAGVTYYDLIWPSFMLMVGVAIPFSFARRSLEQSRGRRWAGIFKRAVILFLLGSLRASLSENAPRWIELSSALQPIAVAYLVTALIASCSARMHVIIAVSIWAGYALLLAVVPAFGIPAGTYEVNHNIVTAFDQWLIGRAHRDGWGTVLSTIPTIATTMLGAVIGRRLMGDASAREKMLFIGGIGFACLAVGWALSPVVPVIMKLWTTSYGLIATGWACLLLLAFYSVIDVRQWKRGALVFVVVGTNALAAYLLPTIIPVSRIVGTFSKPAVAGLAASTALIISTGAVVLVNWLILFWLFRRKIFLRP